MTVRPDFLRLAEWADLQEQVEQSYLVDPNLENVVWRNVSSQSRAHWKIEVDGEWRPRARGGKKIPPLIIFQFISSYYQIARNRCTNY